MQRDAKGYLEDIRGAGEKIRTFAHDKTLDDYLNDDMLRSAIERNFEIIGEAMVQLRKLDPALAMQFSHVRDIAAFRNQLVHAYMTLADATVWSIVQTYLPILLQEVAAAFEQLG